MPLRSGLASAMARRCVVSCSPILSESVRITDQTGSSGFFGSIGRIEADELLVVLHQLERFGPRADLLGDAVQLIIEDVTQALGEDERKDELLVFRRVLGAADRAGGIPDPGFEGFPVLDYSWASSIQSFNFRMRMTTKLARSLLRGLESIICVRSIEWKYFHLLRR